MTIDSPAQLVNEFKKSGEFDRLRQKLLEEVVRGSSMKTLKRRVGEVAQQRFNSDPKISFMPPDAIYKELMEDMDRYPIVERVAEESHLLSDSSFTESIRSSLQKILLEYKEQESQPPPDANEESASSLVTPSTNSLPIEPVSGPSSVPVNAAPARPESNDSQAPPPISTLEGTSGQVSALEGTLETEQVDPHTNEQRLEHENADVEMTDACRQAETTTTT